MDDAQLDKLLRMVGDAETRDHAPHDCPELSVLYLNHTEGQPLGESAEHVRACPRCARRLELIRQELQRASESRQPVITSAIATLMVSVSRYRLTFATSGFAAAACLLFVFFFLRTEARADAWEDARNAEAFCAYDDALEAVDQALRDKPGRLEALLLRARVLAIKGQKREAASILEDVLRRDPTAWAANLQLASILGEANPPRAQELETIAMQYMPPTADASYLHGLITLDWKEAHRLFSEAIDRDPTHVWARLRRAWASYELRDFAMMWADAEVLTVLRPAWLNTWDTLGVALDRIGRSERAVRAFSRTIELDPRNAYNYCHRANALVRSGDYEEALADCDVAKRLDPNSLEAYWISGRAHRFLGNIDQAIADFQRHVEAKPAHAYGYLQLVIVLREAGRWHDAEKVLRQAAVCGDIDMWPTQLIHFYLHKLTEGEFLATAGSDLVQLCEAWYYVGEARLANGDRPAAIRAFGEARAEKILDCIELDFAKWRCGQGDNRKP